MVMKLYINEGPHYLGAVIADEDYGLDLALCNQNQLTIVEEFLDDDVFHKNHHM